jgi:hypothetical protein
MGGPGSTRWRGHTPKPIAEHTPALDFLSSTLKAALQQPRRADGMLRWTDSGGRLVLAATFDLGPVQDDDSRRLILRFSEDPYEPKELVIVQRVQVGFSGRWYARCRDCARRVRKLYQKATWVSGQTRYGCQQCAGVEYLASRQHDKRIDALRRRPNTMMRERMRLHGRYSEFVTWKIFCEAERRGIEWHGDANRYDVMLAEATPEEREILERLPPPRTRLRRRQDRRRQSDPSPLAR